MQFKDPKLDARAAQRLARPAQLVSGEVLWGHLFEEYRARFRRFYRPFWGTELLFTRIPQDPIIWP